MRIFELKSKTPAVVIICLLIVVWNPELRALLFLSQAMGAEVVLAFMVIQLRSSLPFVNACVTQLATACRSALFKVARSLAWLAFGLMPRPYILLSTNVRTLHLGSAF